MNKNAKNQNATATTATASRAKRATSKGQAQASKISIEERFSAMSAERAALREQYNEAGAPKGEGLDDAGRNAAKTADKHAKALATIAGLPAAALALIEPSAAHIAALGCKEKEYAAQIARHVAGVKSGPVRFIKAAAAVLAAGGDTPALTDTQLTAPMAQGTTRQAQAFRKVMLAFGAAEGRVGESRAIYNAQSELVRKLAS